MGVVRKLGDRGDEVVGVLLLAGYVGKGDAAAAAGLVLHHDRLGEEFISFDGGSQGPGEDIASAAGAGLNDDGDGLFREYSPVLSGGVSGPEGDKQNTQTKQRQHSTVFHSYPP